ncbi:SseB family protein [Clavibacter michiganensis]|uniref:SseB family protein n=1 Tax=Clavibacter michiganensis TaxID=28447 RepID=UPI000B3A4814|nr:SseB family protein [Clavibacter michiganensis]MDO4032561.1 SseB family protein [Clavibacter michiganensis]MDO4081887.1 SseB family protein [Clavibacter michiganensis]MDO4088051.1 SseB family protein [Clavibacter michiganensis]MDO4096590.1 SseB family protein [Clavibacter michiganensis]MWJ04507.1 SseB family protein [Clavibacter michiganensis subsp. michiganensis]
MTGSSPHADSAGTPWAGRSFEPTPFPDDDGSAPPAVAAALARHGRGEVGQAAVVDALRDARLLIPLVARLGEEGEGVHGLKADKSAELSIITVAGPDGRTVMPVFTSVAAMGRWNPAARPVPADAVRVALAAASEETDLVVVDPMSDTEFVLRRPAVWAVARSLPWIPSPEDPEVVAALEASVVEEPAVVSVSTAPGDPRARLEGPELMIALELVDGLDRPALDALLARLQGEWSRSAVLADRVDSMGLRITSAR